MCKKDEKYILSSSGGIGPLMHRRSTSGNEVIRGEGSPLGDQRSEEKGLLWETRDQRRRISPDHAGMKNISAEVSIICL